MFNKDIKQLQRKQVLVLIVLFVAIVAGCSITNAVVNKTQVYKKQNAIVQDDTHVLDLNQTSSVQLGADNDNE